VGFAFATTRNGGLRCEFIELTRDGRMDTLARGPLDYTIHKDTIKDTLRHCFDFDKLRNQWLMASKRSVIRRRRGAMVSEGSPSTGTSSILFSLHRDHIQLWSSLECVFTFIRRIFSYL